MFKKIVLSLLFLFSTVMSYAVKLEDNLLKDKQGNTIAIKEYKRVIILDPAVVETFYMIGAEDNIAAIGKTMSSKIYPMEKTEKIPSVGNISTPSLEKILSFSPDLVILGAMTTKIGDNLKILGIPYINSEYSSINDILESIKAYGKLTGKEIEAEKLYGKSLNSIKNIEKQVATKPLNLSGAILFSSSPMMVFTNKSLPGEILEILGVNNIANKLVGNRPILSQEFLLKEDPDFLAGSMGIKDSDSILKSNPTMMKTKVGKNKNIIPIETYKILRGSPRIFTAIEELYEKLQKIK